MGFNIQEELKKLPDRPGVYLMHDAQDEIIYVGKAISLKNRVRQYFQKRDRSPKIERMISLIDHFEYIIVDSEMEALVLECNLIKENRPKYNTMLMDDKTYPFICITVNEPFPRVFLTRNRKNQKARYFGPYTNVTAVKDTLELLRRLYRIRTCSKKLDGTPCDRPCLYFHMDQCKGPCSGEVSRETYGEDIEKVISFLEGNYSPVIKELKAKMYEASEAMEFEKAAEFRDLMNSVTALYDTQRVTMSDEGNRDVIGIARADDEAIAQVFFIRGGKLTGKEHFHLTGTAHETRSETLTQFVKQYYAGAPSIPGEILLCDDINETELIAEWLGTRRHKKVNILAPKRGDKVKLVKLATQNASLILHRDSEKIAAEEARTTGALRELSDMLSLTGIVRLESYDISNISGFESVGSMVVYENGVPKRSDYRKFRIRSVSGPDDYASMREVLTRRFLHGLDEREELESKNLDVKSLGSFTRFPDLILMDGGRGQVNICLEVLESLNLHIPVAGMVKDDNHRTRGLYFNNVEIPIDTHGEAFKLITRVQDETHRFAIEYHKLLRSKTQVKSILDDIPGIGEKRRRGLMKHFESIEAVRAASVEELSEAPGMNREAAESVYLFFRKKEVHAETED